MLRLIGRILIIVLALSLVSGAMYLWVQNGSAQTALAAEQGGIRSRTTLNADFNGQGRVGGDRESGGLLAAWIAGIVRNVIVLSVITLGVAILQRFFTMVLRKRRIPEPMV